MTIQGYNADSQRAIGKIHNNVSWQTWSLKSRVMWLKTTRPTIYCWEGLGFTGTLLFRPPSINASNMSTRTKKYKQNSLRRSEAGVEAYCADSKLYDPASGDKEEEVISASRKAKKSRWARALVGFPCFLGCLFASCHGLSDLNAVRAALVLACSYSFNAANSALPLTASATLLNRLSIPRKSPFKLWIATENSLVSKAHGRCCS